MEEKPRKPDLPKERAKFVDAWKRKDGEMPDSYAVFLGGIFTVFSFVSGFFTLAGSFLAGLMRALFALAAIILVARDIRTFRSGQIIAVIAAILFFLGMMNVVS